MQAKDLQAEIGHEEDSFAAYWIVLASCMCHVFTAVCMCLQLYACVAGAIPAGQGLRR